MNADWSASLGSRWSLICNSWWLLESFKKVDNIHPILPPQGLVGINFLNLILIYIFWKLGISWLSDESLGMQFAFIISWINIVCPDTSYNQNIWYSIREASPASYCSLLTFNLSLMKQFWVWQATWNEFKSLRHFFFKLVLNVIKLLYREIINIYGVTNPY